jgi:hypothetical protein
MESMTPERMNQQMALLDELLAVAPNPNHRRYTTIRALLTHFQVMSGSRE